MKLTIETFVQLEIIHRFQLSRRIRIFMEKGKKYI